MAEGGGRVAKAPDETSLSDALPSGKRCHVTIEHFSWENSLEMAIFNCKLLVITRGLKHVKTKQQQQLRADCPGDFESKPDEMTTLAISGQLRLIKLFLLVYPLVMTGT